MKKLLCILLAIMCLCLVGCNDMPTAETTPTNDNAENTPTEQEPITPPCEHNFILLQSTTDCETAGYEIWICSKCNEYKNIEVVNPSHKYDKNICGVCGKLEASDISNLSPENKTYLYDELEKNATELFYDYNGLTEGVSKLAKLYVGYCTAKHNLSLYWEGQAPQEEIEAFENLKIEYINCKNIVYGQCEGYTWYMVLNACKDKNANNKDIREAASITREIFATYPQDTILHYPTPYDWEWKIVGLIENLVGIRV